MLADEISRGEGIGCAVAAKLFPPARAGKPVHPATVTRWIIAGQRTADGRTVRLAAVKLGSHWVTTPGAVRRFVGELMLQPATATNHGDDERHAATERELAALGVG